MNERESREPADEIAVVADDMDEFIDRIRYQQLFDARETAANVIRDGAMSKIEMGQRGYTEAEAARVDAKRVRSAVVSYVLEAEPLFRNTEAGRKFWNRRTFGPASLDDVTPAVKWDEVQGYDISWAPDGVSFYGDPPNSVEVMGMRPFVQLDNAYLEVRKPPGTDWMNRKKSRGPQTETHELLTPPELSVQAFRATNDLLTELGIGLQAETEEEKGAEWSADYRDED